MSMLDLRGALRASDWARARAAAVAVAFADDGADDDAMREALAEVANAERRAGRAAWASSALRDWLCAAGESAPVVEAVASADSEALTLVDPEPPSLEVEPEPVPNGAWLVPEHPAEKAAAAAALKIAVARLAKRFDGSGPTARADVTLDDAVRALPPMPPLHDYASAVAEVERLELLSDPRALGQWRLLRDLDGQRRLLASLVARSRRAQDAPCIAGDGALRARVSNVYPRLLTFLREARPGWVNGLQRDHAPKSKATWDAEAAALLAELQLRCPAQTATPRSGPNPERTLTDLQAALDLNRTDLSGRVNDCLRAGIATDDPRLLRMLHGRDVALNGKQFKRLRKAVRAFATQDAPENNESVSDGPVPRDWVLRSVTEGKRAVLVGGDQRTAANEALQTAFGFESLEWLDGLKHHQVDALAERVRNGRYDLVILLARFASHSVQNVVSPACAAAGVPWVLVPRGYGSTAVMRAIEAAHGVRLRGAGGVPRAKVGDGVRSLEARTTSACPNKPELRGM